MVAGSVPLEMPSSTEKKEHTCRKAGIPFLLKRAQTEHLTALNLRKLLRRYKRSKAVKDRRINIFYNNTTSV